MIHSRISTNNMYSVTYDRYVTSLMNGEHGNNEFIDYEKNHITLEKNYTLDEKIEYFLEKNPFKLDMYLVVVSKENMDAPLNFSKAIYKSYLMKFWGQQINQQTIDLHILKVRSFFDSRKQYLNLLFRAFNQIDLTDKSVQQNEATQGGGKSTLERRADSTVPENEVDVDVANTTLTYADDFYKLKRDETDNSTSNSEQTTTSIKEKDLTFVFNLPRDLDLMWLWQEVIKEQLFMVVN